MNIKFIDLGIWPTGSEDEVYNEPWTDIANDGSAFLV
jgi:hypothetical protein